MGMELIIKIASAVFLLWPKTYIFDGRLFGGDQMISKVNLVLSGIVYCLKGMAVSVKEKTGKYSII